MPEAAKRDLARDLLKDVAHWHLVSHPDLSAVGETERE
jgi:hypothetical protein